MNLKLIGRGAFAMTLLFCTGMAYAQTARVASAKTPVTDSTGALWEAANGFIGGWNWPGNATSIAGTTETALYRPEWVGMSGWRRTLPNGRYEVTLKMRESWWNTPGSRVLA